MHLLITRLSFGCLDLSAEHIF